jgi:protocatechuate 3,4-dioxygenase beta subunit
MKCGGRRYAVAGGKRSLPLALGVLFLSGILLLASGGEGKGAPASGPCSPTPADMEGPFYKPGAPARTATGSGLVVRGRLLGIPDCRPLAGGRIEWWQADRRGRYDDDHRGTQAVSPDGAYRFSTDFPGIYPGRPPHIHFKAAAPGYRPLTTQMYLRGGESEAEFDIVLVPAD